MFDADLVLEGGGVKGIALVGAISVLEERGYRFHRVAGTSAGAIVGSLVAAGVGAEELAGIMREVDYQRFRDESTVDRLGKIGKGISLLLDRGIYEGNYAREWLAGLLAEHGVTTFADLRDDDPGSALPADQRYRLVVMASDISAGCLRRLPWDCDCYTVGSDEMRVADAVRASMSIPFFYEPVELEDRAGEPCVIVDGGMLSNFPIDVFDRTDAVRPRWPTLGIKLSAKPESIGGAIHDVDGTFSMAHAMLSTMMGFYDRMHIDDPAVVARTIFVDTLGVKATDFHIDRATQERLYENGRSAATKFLDGSDDRPAWDFTAYLEQHRSG